MLRVLTILICLMALDIARPAMAQPVGRPAGPDNASQGMILLRKQNPLIDDVARIDPDELWNLLSKLEFLTTNHGAPARTGAPPSVDEGSQITANQAFSQAYKNDPGGTLVLLREINEAMRKARQGSELGLPRRLALVVGDSSAEAWGKLGNANHDAALIAQTLKTLGFDLVSGGALIDPDRFHLQQAIRDFGHSIGPETVALFYFAGHGVQYAGHNYLVPVDALIPQSEDDYDRTMVEVDGTVLRRMQEAGGRLNIIVLDACRDHPPLPRALTVASRGGPAPGLAMTSAPPGMNGTVIIYSTAPNDIARDRVNDNDTNSPFATAFAEAIVRPGVEMRDAFDSVQEEVMRATKNSQQPWISYAAIGKFSFSDQPLIQNASSRLLASPAGGLPGLAKPPPPLGGPIQPSNNRVPPPTTPTQGKRCDTWGGQTFCE
jgi:Caspase domain